MLDLNKTIDTLVEDIYAFISDDTRRTTESITERSDKRITEFGERLSKLIYNKLYGPSRTPNLSLSQLGVPDRKLWYQTRHPELAEPLPAAAKIKFLYGDILEELLLFLAEESGHKVEGRQDELDVNGVKGHRDCVIDGRLVDVKSASTYSYKKFDTGNLVNDDPFGYLDQLGSYLSASSNDPLVKEKDLASFLVIDKTLGNICLDTHPRTNVDYKELVAHKKKVLEQETPPTKKCYEEVPEGKSGNFKLSTGCSYCPFKQTCWPGLRTFIYSTGPVFLTKVVREPKVVEIT